MPLSVAVLQRGWILRAMRVRLHVMLPQNRSNRHRRIGTKTRGRKRCITTQSPQKQRRFWQQNKTQIEWTVTLGVMSMNRVATPTCDVSMQISTQPRMNRKCLNAVFVWLSSSIDCMLLIGMSKVLELIITWTGTRSTIRRSVLWDSARISTCCVSLCVYNNYM